MLAIFLPSLLSSKKMEKKTRRACKKPCLCFAYFAYLYYVAASITAHQRKVDKIERRIRCVKGENIYLPGRKRNGSKENERIER